MKIFYSFIFCAMLSESCKTASSNKDFKDAFQTGTYVRESTSNFKLHFSKDSFYYYLDSDNPAIYYCCDTMAAGNYKFDKANKLLYLWSFSGITPAYFKINVTEKFKPALNDSITIIINSQFINKWNADANNENQDTNAIKYKIIIENAAFQFRVYTSNSSRFSIPNTKAARIKRITVEIAPDFRIIRLSNPVTQFILTEPYSVKDSISNEFHVNLPDLSLNYLAYRKLDKDIIRIIDNYKVEWDGHIYIYQKYLSP